MKGKHHESNGIKRIPRFWIILIIVIIVNISGILLYLFYPFSHTEIGNSDIDYETSYTDDPTIELGDEQIRTNGELGLKETEITVKRTLSGNEISREITSERIIKAPVNKHVVKGTKRYQFMWCSNGSYRYFTSDEFKKPGAGFTKKSPDHCSKNGQGNMTKLSDSAPPQPQATYSPAPTVTRCFDSGLYSSSFTCYSR